MKHSVTGQRKTRLLWTVPCIAAVLILATFVASGAAVGGDVPKIVQGYIWDSTKRPLGGTTVTVKIVNRTDQTVRAQRIVSSQSDGLYSANFANTDWDANDRIEVIAVYQSAQYNNTTVAVAGMVLQWVNVTFPYEIEEFGSAAGLVLAGGLLGCVAVAFVALRRRPKGV